MSPRSEILNQIAAVASDVLHWQGDLNEEARLVEDLGLDSIRALTLLVEIENRLRVRLTPQDEAGIVTVGDLINVIERRRRHES